MKAFMVRVFGRRAVSGAITGMFVVLIFVAAISALLAYNVSQDRYNRAVSERNQMEWERLNEKIIISSAERLEEDGTLNATVMNLGAVTAHLVSLWLSAYDANNDPRWQRQYTIDVWVSPGETKTNLGQKCYSYTLIRGQTSEDRTTIELPDEEWTYTVKLVTERGNVAIYVLQPPEEEVEVEGPPLAYSSGSMKIKYAFLQEWKSPYISVGELWSALNAQDPQKLRVKATFTNIANYPITITQGNILLQICDAPENKKVSALGGYLLEGSGTYQPGESFDAIWIIDRYTFNNEQQLRDLVGSYPNRRVTFLGSAAFSTSPREPFFIVAILMDGLLVYE